MPDWRDYILQHFQTPSHRLTLVADPDGLMLEERLLSAIHANGFQLLRFDDPVQFRYAYERQFRHKWDRAEETELVVVLRTPEHDLRSLPFDLWQSGRQLKFQLFDLFPKLSYPVLRELERADLDSLYPAYQTYLGDELGDQGTRAYLLRQVFGVNLDALRTPGDVLKHLLSRHYAARRVPASIDSVLLQRLEQLPSLEGWPLSALLADRNAFYNFLQEAWPRFLVEQKSQLTGVRESRVPYGAGAVSLPLDTPDIRAFVDTLFLEGYLRPISVPDDWPVDGWTEIGVVRKPEIDRQIRFEKIAAVSRVQMPESSATYQTWLKFARTWAETLVLRYSLPLSSPIPESVAFDEIQHRLEQQFAEWMLNRYLALHNYPPLPVPVMLHQIPYYLAYQLKAAKFQRVALLVVDGLALNQWLVIQEKLRQAHQEWRFDESAVFAWVPTLTPISRQSIFAARTPLSFPNTWQRTDREKSHWERFWKDEGLPEAAIGYFKGSNLDDDPALEAWLLDTRSTVAGLVVNKVDDIMHGMQLGTTGMHQQVGLWADQGHLARLLTKLDQAGFTTFITADHGNISAKGIGKPQQGALVESQGQRALQFSEPEFLTQAQTQYPSAIGWRSDALPEAIHVLLADSLNAFHTLAEEVVCHGGISLEEVIVPFVQVMGVPQ